MFIVRFSDLCSLLRRFRYVRYLVLWEFIWSLSFKALSSKCQFVRPTSQVSRVGLCYDPLRFIMRFSDLCSLVRAFRVSPIPCALGVHLEPAVQRAEFKVLTRKTDESCVESSL